jgi:hypothetical protein
LPIKLKKILILSKFSPFLKIMNLLPLEALAARKRPDVYPLMIL